MAQKNVRITNKLPAFSDKVERKATRAVTKMVITGAAHASVYTPVDTSALLNSQFRKVVNLTHKVIGIVGYTADYAAAVHDPDNPQTFRRTTAKKEFLRLGFEESEGLLRSILKQEMKP